VPQSLRIDPTQLRLSAGRLDVANDAAKAQLTQNATALAGSKAGWAGTAHTAFEQLRDTWEHADTARANRLEDIATNLRGSAAEYQLTDEAGADDIDTAL